ncbi:MAG: hypothetical protein U5L95_03185 [Candidatus Saccharibacteria bacterium]|nr:hypothetical protein [Candidatus Saccharibacteria bacterium]
MALIFVSATNDPLLTVDQALSRSSKVVVSDTDKFTDTNHPDFTTFDARNAHIDGVVRSNADAYLVRVGHRNPSKQTAWIGGLVTSDVDRNFSWHRLKSDRDGAGIKFDAEDWWVIDGLRLDNTMDAIRPHVTGSDRQWEVRNTWAEYTRDDFIENDHTSAPGGRIHDTLVDGVFMFLSVGQNQTWDGDNPYHISNTIVDLKPMPYDSDEKTPYMEDAYGFDADRHGHLFKRYDSSDPPMYVSDTVFIVRQHAGRRDKTDGSTGKWLDVRQCHARLVPRQ